MGGGFASVPLLLVMLGKPSSDEVGLLFASGLLATFFVPMMARPLLQRRGYMALLLNRRLLALDRLAEKVRRTCGPVAGQAAHDLVDVGCEMVRVREAMAGSGGVLPGADAHADRLKDDLDLQLDDLGRQLHDLLHFAAKRRLSRRLAEVGEPAQWIETRERLEGVRQTALSRMG